MKRVYIAGTVMALCSVLFCQFVRNLPAAPRGGDQDAAPGRDSPPPVKKVGYPTFMSPHASPIVAGETMVFVANTPADTVDVIDAKTRRIVDRIPVGIDPVGLALRPDGKELWVANHVSDSVSVIDTNPASLTYLRVIATVQQIDADTRATRFDEPVGIAFANDQKAYVALSSENTIAVVDVAQRRVVKRLIIPAQDPRAIAVRGEKLYVIPFESNNRTQLSGGSKEEIDGKLVTFDAWDHSIANNNVLSLGHVVDIVKHPEVPDRDLFVYDTATDELIETVDTLGTLLYGLAIDAHGTVYVAQTDARNDVNGRSGTKKHGLAELENRAFLNRITVVRPRGAEDRVGFFDLEPLPPAHPQPGMTLATPYALALSRDETMLVVAAAASDKLATVDAVSGRVLGRVTVGAVPRGIAIEQGAADPAARVWALNAAANTVSVVDLADPANPRVVDTLTLADPTHPVVKRGRIAFETAAASTTHTYSCASCHPDGHTDQLLWVLNTPVVTGGDQIMPRSTMPIRGLRDTEPYHWDGIPGDPYGGNNSANVHGADPPNSTPGDPVSSARHLVDGGLANTMKRVDDASVNDEGKAGALSAAQREDLSRFLLSVPYPPAQRRAYSDALSEHARAGFKLFHIEGDREPGKPRANVCGDCHRMPFLVSTNTPGTGMDAPTWRGAYDRYLILPQGRLNIIDFGFYRRIAELGIPEREMWRFSWGGRPRFDPVWNMVLEGSTGFSGAFGRQVTLDRGTVTQTLTLDVIQALERAAQDERIVLQVEGVLLNDSGATSLPLQYSAESREGEYVERAGKRRVYRREQLLALAGKGRFIGTFTGCAGSNVDVNHPQPALWTRGPIQSQRGRQEFPVVTPQRTTMTLSARHVAANARLFVDGARVSGRIQRDGDEMNVELASPLAIGMHFLQVQNPGGLFSNEFIFHVAERPTQQATDSATEMPTLGNVLLKGRWQRLVGTWGDAGTKGAVRKTTYAWKIKDRVLEVSTTEPDNQSVGLIAVNSQNGDVFFVGADRKGGSFLGTWDFSQPNQASVELGVTAGNGRQGSLRLKHKLIDDDTMIVTVELPQPITFKMVRLKSATREQAPASAPASDTRDP